MCRSVPLLALAALSLAFAPAPLPKAPPWLKAYRKADKRGREVLLKTWLAKGGNALDLLHDCSPEERAAAKDVLAELWRSEQLSPQARAATVRAFVSMRLVERPAWDAARGQRELMLQVDRRFSFPKGTWLRWNYAIAIGGRALRLDPASWNTRDWEGTGPLALGSLGSGGHFGAPSAEAVIEVWEPDPKRPGKDRWRLRWSVAPTKLRLLARPR